MARLKPPGRAHIGIHLVCAGKMAGKEEAAVSDGMGDKRELAVELGPGAAFLVADAEDMTEHSSDGAVKLLAQRLVQGPRLAAIKEDAEDKGLEQNALASLTQVAAGPEPKTEHK